MLFPDPHSTESQSSPTKTVITSLDIQFQMLSQVSETPWNTMYLFTYHNPRNILHESEQKSARCGSYMQVESRPHFIVTLNKWYIYICIHTNTANSDETICVHIYRILGFFFLQNEISKRPPALSGTKHIMIYSGFIITLINGVWDSKSILFGYIYNLLE